MKYFYFCIATFFGIGKMPFAPGTWASLVSVFLFYPLLNISLVYYAGILVLIYFLGVFACTRYAGNLGEIDPSSAVIDEVLGMGVAMAGIPQKIPYAIMALILFRIFDIWKPYPIRRIEKLPGGWGIMTDDLVAGIYALAWIKIGKILVDSIT
jgi:phosphatidylglycerophosphatase A